MGYKSAYKDYDCTYTGSNKGLFKPIGSNCGAFGSNNIGFLGRCICPNSRSFSTNSSGGLVGLKYHIGKALNKTIHLLGHSFKSLQALNNGNTGLKLHHCLLEFLTLVSGKCQNTLKGIETTHKAGSDARNIA